MSRSAEALRQAEAEGLTLLRNVEGGRYSNTTGYKGVRFINGAL